MKHKDIEQVNPTIFKYFTPECKEESESANNGAAPSITDNSLQKCSEVTDANNKFVQTLSDNPQVSTEK